MMLHKLKRRCLPPSPAQWNQLSKRTISLSSIPTFDKDPTLHIELPDHNATIDILTLSHWVDIQYFEQNKLSDCTTLGEWLDSKSPTHILLDICPNRLEFVHRYHVENGKPEEISRQQIDDILHKLDDVEAAEELEYDLKTNVLPTDVVRDHFFRLKRQSKKMKRFIDKTERLDEIHKLRLLVAADKQEKPSILRQMKLTEPVFSEVDIWYFELYWNVFEKFFKNLVPHFAEFKREFYLNALKFRFLNLVYGEEIPIVLDYFEAQQEQHAGHIVDYNESGKYRYKLPRLKSINSSKNKFDEYMKQVLAYHDDDAAADAASQQLMAVYEHEDSALQLVAGGMPIEFMYRKLQKIKKPMLWIEFAMAIKNYFSDKHMQNLANQMPMICDLHESMLTPHAKRMKLNSWDSTIELNEMIECVSPQFYDLLVEQQSQYLFHSLLKLLAQNQQYDIDEVEANAPQKPHQNIVIVTGQGIAQSLNQLIYDLIANKRSFQTRLSNSNSST